MDLARSPADESFRAEARAWLRTHVPPEPLPSLETAEGFAAHRVWESELAADRWSVVDWPTEYGGRAAGLLRRLVFEEEYYAAGAPGRVGQNGISLLAPTLFDHGTREQRARVLPPMASGEVVWAQAWSEPEAGSDLASLTSRAVRTDGGWLLTGQKTWSSRAAFADRAFGLFRSEPGTPKPHQGLTYLMFDLRAPGVTVRPIGRLDGRPAFAELFLDEVFVPDQDVIGEPGQGWRIAMSTAGNERGLTLRPPGRFLASADRLFDLWQAQGSPASAHDRVADALIGARAYQLFTYAAASRFLEGTPVGPESSLNKVFWSEYDIALHETALELLGEEGESTDTDWSEGYVFSLAGPIYAGTNEIQRDIIAERLLGLPKGRR
ncbi:MULTISPECIES: acyl-CoA dehydrogenase family protein [Streptomyces]|uniref:acyl-CoA dehydrogenase family protein n=1 Tax=Streptomyces TaxID=1883 RepID=UPI000A3A55E3|nr:MULTISPECIES: acyl-CoA dehydrogenase family protein [Streptomyces]MDX3581533.1 acyl-CoA dehydrogenase family protein [Streptomyces europaeiscabiei]MDX3618137.1 acyl-CoA dehydrogenase family protein [Streptomyces europaeiscabiei]MDX3633023.1 acyl-CoA dehydrogenase family protein [Streptomyces europaeiscabiei]MDX3650468.1 acyl-CoA dehydrogenase family protein [Streptomyces europaeiscabiei]WUD32043.1 acyl-CoA dehydrogenase family protein [Streptomyces europaeiscabiei]